MPYEELEKRFNAQKAITKDVKAAWRGEYELKALANSRQFEQHRQAAADYVESRNVRKRISKSTEKEQYRRSNISRFVVHYLVPETSPEAKEQNEDFNDMMYAPEGQQWLADHVIGATLGADLSLGFPTTLDEAFDMALEHPTVGEQMMDVVKITESHEDYKIAPLIAEQLKYNKTAIQLASYGQAMVDYYSSDMCCAFSTKFTDKDISTLKTNVDKAKLPSEQGKLLFDAGSQLMLFNEGDSKAKRDTITRLKEEGVIGPESMFYRCYDDKNKRIDFVKAVNDRAAGKTVEFRKMEKAEQEELLKALKNPTTLNKKDPGALYGKDFQKECGDLYNALDGVDKAFIRSSKQFREIKKSLKEMSSRKTIPNADEAKKFLHDVVKLTSSYLNEKDVIKGNRSDYAKNRLAAMKNVHKSLSAKLGALAFNSYKFRTATREKYEENQKNMSTALDGVNIDKIGDKIFSDVNNEQPADEIVTEKDVKQPAEEPKTEKDENQINAELNEAFADVKEQIEPIKKIDENPDEFMTKAEARDIDDIFDEDFLYPYDENPEMDPSFLADVKTEEVPFLHELTDRSLFDKKTDELKLSGMEKQNVKYLYEKAVKARKTLEDKCASGKERVNAREMKDIIAYGIVKYGLDNKSADSVREFISTEDVRKGNPDVLVSPSLKTYYDREHSADAVRDMLNDIEKLESKCSNGRAEMNNRIEIEKKKQEILFEEPDLAPELADMDKSVDHDQTNKSFESSVLQ